jgi:phosphoribosylaminoimidazole-succinocarboxamide synthase
MGALLESLIPGIPLRRGKVRDVYDLGDTVLLVATDRISAFDVIMPTGIPDKGAILTQLSNFWFGFFEREMPGIRHHLVATELAQFPAALQGYGEQLRGRAVIGRKTKVVPIECVVRGYITGSGWKDYQKSGVVSGVKLPGGLRQCEKLPAPIFTPTTKAEAGHDMPISFEAACGEVGAELMTRARDLAVGLYVKASDYARSRGIIIADTKFEFGTRGDVEGGKAPILIDEALTPDSSRFWPAEGYEPGHDQPSFDKQYVRDYLETLSWGKVPPGPVLPGDVVGNTRAKYVEAYEKLTGRRFGG